MTPATSPVSQVALIRPLAGFCCGLAVLTVFWPDWIEALTGSKRPGRAPAFYVRIAAATLVGAALNFTPLDSVKALIWSAIINGVAAVPIMVMIMLMASRRGMGEFALTKRLVVLGWLATAVMGAAAAGMFATWGS
jgi:Mn2+/Fe2+ NRAMP family transporter